MTPKDNLTARPDASFEDDFSDLDLMDDNFNSSDSSSENKNNASNPLNNQTSSVQSKKIQDILIFILFAAGLILIAGYFIWPKISRTVPNFQPNTTNNSSAIPLPKTPTSPLPLPASQTPPDTQYSESGSDPTQSETLPNTNSSTSQNTHAPSEHPASSLLTKIKTIQSEFSDLASKTAGADDAIISEETIAVQKALDNLNQKIQKQTDQVDNLEETLILMSKTLEQINQNFTQINTRINTVETKSNLLDQSYQSLQKTIQKEDLDLEKTPLPESPLNPQLTYQAPNYTIHAVIPGRAWLRSLSGQDLTISEGDNLDPYGTVLVIDAQNGVVITSSGMILR